MGARERLIVTFGVAYFHCTCAKNI